MRGTGESRVRSRSASFRVDTSLTAQPQTSPRVGTLNLRGIAAVAFFLLAGFGPNFEVALWSAFALFCGISILWRRGEFPLLLFVFLLAWLQASVAIFHSNYLGIELQRYSHSGGDMRLATLLSLAGLVTMAVGMRLGAGAPNPQLTQGALAIARSNKLSKWFTAYLIAAILCYVAVALAWSQSGLTQFMLAVANLKWAFFFMLAFAAIARGAYWTPYLVLPFFGEFILSVGGFFSDFKTVFIVSLLAFSAASLRFTIRSGIVMVLFAFVLVIMGAAWSSVKTDYRHFASGGTNSQAVVVDYQTRVSKLASLVCDLDGGALSSGLDQLMHRLSYVEFFAAELYRIPTFVPFQDGAITADAVLRPFTPRILFPEKEGIDDTTRTRQLTGVKMQGGSTSISLGYVGEFYADFGIPGMFAALVVLGWLYGRTFRWLMNDRKFAGPLGMGLACVVLMQLGGLENSFTKIFGGLVVSLLACWAIARFVIRRYCPWVLLDA
jgi:hypothetical protein